MKALQTSLAVCLGGASKVISTVLARGTLSCSFNRAGISGMGVDTPKLLTSMEEGSLLMRVTEVSSQVNIRGIWLEDD